jgi:hypothetical protein
MWQLIDLTYEQSGAAMRPGGVSHCVTHDRVTPLGELPAAVAGFFSLSGKISLGWSAYQRRR